MCVASNNRCNNCFIFLSCFLFTSFLLYIYFYFCHLFIFFYLCVSTKILTIIKMYSNTYKTGCAFINNCCWCQIWPVENFLLPSVLVRLCYWSNECQTGLGGVGVPFVFSGILSLVFYMSLYSIIQQILVALCKNNCCYNYYRL